MHRKEEINAIHYIFQCNFSYKLDGLSTSVCELKENYVYECLFYRISYLFPMLGMEDSTFHHHGIC